MALTPERFQLRSYPSPLATDVLFYEIRDSVLPKNKQPEYGDPHPNTTLWPHHFLVFIQQATRDSDGKQMWWYAAERENQDLYNWTHSEADIGGTKFDSITREYVILREDFDPESPAQGAAMADIPASTFNGMHVLAERSMVKAQDQEISSLFVFERRTYVKKVTFSDNVFDERLSVNRQSRTTLYYRGETISGTPIETLVADEDNAYWGLQSDKHSRTGQQLTANWFSVVETRETLRRGTGGELTADWPRRQKKTKGQEDISLTPQKFKRLLTTKQTIDTIDLPAANVNDIPAPATPAGDVTFTRTEKVNDFRYEDETLEEIINEDADPFHSPSQEEQLYDTIESLVDEGDAPDSGAGVIYSRVDALGNGKAVKTTRIALTSYTSPATNVPGYEHFPSFTTGKQETIPAAMLAKLGMKVWQYKINSSSDDLGPAIGDGVDGYAGYSIIEKVIKKVQVQPDDDAYEVTVIGLKSGSSLIVDKAVTSAMTGGTLQVSRELVDTDENPEPEEGFLILDSEVTDLQNGKSLVEKREFTNDFEELQGQTYDADLGFDIPFTEQVIAAASVYTEADIQPMDKWRSKKKQIDYAAFREQLNSIHIILPGEENVNVPDTLLGVTVLVSRSQAVGNSFGQGGGFNASMDGNVSLSADLSYEIEEGYSGPVASETHIFFMAQDQADPMTFIKGKCNALEWPRYRPTTKRIVISGHGLQQSVRIASSDNGSQGSESSNAQAFTNVATIPRTIHDSITPTIEYHDFTAPTGVFDTIRDAAIAQWENRLEALRALIDAAPEGTDEFILDYLRSYVDGMEGTIDLASDQDINDYVVQVAPSTLAATAQTAVQEGRFITRSSATMYGFGMVKVTAIVAII